MRASYTSDQSEAEERFIKAEDERWKREVELDEKRRKEDREHELRVLQIIGQSFTNYNQYPHEQQYEDY